MRDLFFDPLAGLIDTSNSGTQSRLLGPCSTRAAASPQLRATHSELKVTMKTSLRSRVSRRWALGLLLCSTTFAVAAHAGLAGLGDSTVNFEAVGPAGLKIDGTGSGVSAKEVGGNLEIEVPVNNLKTGISLRDDHLKKAINADKHPKAKLVVARSALKFPEDKKSLQGSAKGKMTLNGTTKDLDFNYKVDRTGSDYHVQGLATVDITKFGMEIPCYLGVCVDKDVKIKVKFKVRDN